MSAVQQTIIAAAGVRTVRQQVVTARVNDRAVPVAQAHRRWTAADYLPAGAPEAAVEYEPVVVTVTAPVGLSLEDAAAVVFSWNCPPEDLDADDTVRALIAETVIGRGCGDIEEQRCLLGEATTTDPEDAAYLAYCRRRVAEVFSIPSVAVEPVPAVVPVARRELVS